MATTPENQSVKLESLAPSQLKYTEDEYRLRSYIIEVAVTEIPALLLIVALQKRYGKDVPQTATFAAVLNECIDKISDIKEKAHNQTQENYDEVYAEFFKLFVSGLDDFCKDTFGDSYTEKIDEFQKQNENGNN